MWRRSEPTPNSVEYVRIELAGRKTVCTAGVFREEVGDRDSSNLLREIVQLIEHEVNFTELKPRSLTNDFSSVKVSCIAVFYLTLVFRVISYQCGAAYHGGMSRNNLAIAG